MKSTNWMGSIWSYPTCATTRLPPWVRYADLILEWLERSRQRAALARLDDRMLADIGCDRGRIHAEMRKPFWKK